MSVDLVPFLKLLDPQWNGQFGLLNGSQRAQFPGMAYLKGSDDHQMMERSSPSHVTS